MIGIFGGTFDPVHYGHLRSSLEVKEAFDLDEIRLIPSSVPPHRPQPEASTVQRLRMLELAVGKRPDFVIDGRELERPGHSYMVDTLSSLNSEYPDQRLLLFIGCDAFNGLASWHMWRQLFDVAHVIVMTRPGFETSLVDDFLSARRVQDHAALRQNRAGKLAFQPVTPLDISASAIRKLIADQRDPSFLLPDAVLEYIKINQLYGL